MMLSSKIEKPFDQIMKQNRHRKKTEKGLFSYDLLYIHRLAQRTQQTEQKKKQKKPNEKNVASFVV